MKRARKCQRTSHRKYATTAEACHQVHSGGQHTYIVQALHQGIANAPTCCQR